MNLFSHDYEPLKSYMEYSALITLSEKCDESLFILLTISIHGEKRERNQHSRRVLDDVIRVMAMKYSRQISEAAIRIEASHGHDDRSDGDALCNSQCGS